MVKRGGLGKNLSALLGPVQGAASHQPSLAPANTTPLTLAINQLQPGKYQPRGNMDEEALLELAESIKKQGLLQPLLVREISEGHYEIIAGERRWRAATLASLTEVPVLLHQVDDETAMAIALIENLQREDLNAMDQAKAMQRLATEFDLTHQQIATLLSKSRTAVSNYLRLLNLSAEVKAMLENGDLDMGHARCLLALESSQQYQVAKLIVAKNLSVRETETLVERFKKPSLTLKPAPDMNPFFETASHTLAQHLQTKVKIKTNKSGKGTLIIHYNDLHNLQQMLERFMS